LRGLLETGTSLSYTGKTGDIAAGTVTVKGVKDNDPWNIFNLAQYKTTLAAIIAAIPLVQFEVASRSKKFRKVSTK
jgi:hypothetical protein